MTEMQITFEQYSKLYGEIIRIRGGFEKAYFQKRGEVEVLNKHINDLKSEIRFLRRQILKVNENY